MNVTEANATATLLAFLLPPLNPQGQQPVPTDEARDAAAYLAGRANRALGAGPTGFDVDRHWPPVITATTTGDHP